VQSISYGRHPAAGELRNPSKEGQLICRLSAEWTAEDWETCRRRDAREHPEPSGHVAHFSCASWPAAQPSRPNVGQN